MATANVVEMQKSERTENVRLEIVRLIRAPKQRVFDAWTRPEMIRQWFGPGEKTIGGVKMDAKVRGEYSITMNGATCTDGGEGVIEGVDMRRASRATGQYLKVQPYDLLQFTWTGDWDPTEETVITVSLKDVQGGTEMTLVQEGFVTEASCKAHGQGWANSLEKLARTLEGDLPASA